MGNRVKNFFRSVPRIAIPIALASGFALFPPLLSRLHAQETSPTESAEVVKSYSHAQAKAGLMYRTYLGLLNYQDTKFFDENLKPIMDRGAKFGQFKKDITGDGKMVFFPEKADEASDSVNQNWGEFLGLLEKIGDEEKSRITLYAYYGPKWDKRKTGVYVSYVRFLYVDYPDLYGFLKGIVDEAKGLEAQGIDLGCDFSTWGIDETRVVPVGERAPFSESFVMRYTHLKRFFELLAPYSQYHNSKVPTELIPFEIFNRFSRHSATLDADLEEHFAKSELELKYDVYGQGYSNKKALDDFLRNPLLLDHIGWLNDYLNGSYVVNEETTKVVIDPNTGEQKKIAVPREEMQRWSILEMADPKLARAAKSVLKDYGYSVPNK